MSRLTMRGIAVGVALVVAVASVSLLSAWFNLDDNALAMIMVAFIASTTATEVFLRLDEKSRSNIDSANSEQV